VLTVGRSWKKQLGEKKKRGGQTISFWGPGTSSRPVTGAAVGGAREGRRRVVLITEGAKKKEAILLEDGCFGSGQRERRQPGGGMRFPVQKWLEVSDARPEPSGQNHPQTPNKS